jgi:cytochrome P450
MAPPVRGLQSWRWYWRFNRDPLSCLVEAHRRFGQISVFENPIPGPRRGLRYVLAVGAPLNRHVLSRPDDFHPSGQVLKGPRGSAQQRIRRGILKMHGEEHRCHRRAMQPPFSKSAVASTVGLMAPLVDEIIDRWRVGEPLEIFAEMRTLSNWVAAKVLFGNEDFAASVHIGQLIDRWVVLDAETRRWGSMERDLPGTPYRRELRHAEVLEKTMRELIAQKRRAGSPNSDVLSMLIHATDSGQSDMSDDDLVSHSITLYGASFETTAGALAWTLFLIAQHPQCAARLHDEVVQGMADWPPTARTLDAMSYLDAVIRESMRLIPPIPVTFRRVTRPLEFEGMRLDTGDKVALSHFLTHRDPGVFPDPQRFDPSRWFGTKPDPYQYMPFSAGARLCLGAVFAMTELKLALARIVQRYRLAVVPGTRLDPILHLVLRPRTGLPMVPHVQDGVFCRAPMRGNILKLIDLASPESAAHPAPVPLADDARKPVHEEVRCPVSHAAPVG